MQNQARLKQVILTPTHVIPSLVARQVTEDWQAHLSGRVWRMPILEKVANLGRNGIPTHWESCIPAKQRGGKQCGTPQIPNPKPCATNIAIRLPCPWSSLSSYLCRSSTFKAQLFLLAWLLSSQFITIQTALGIVLEGFGNPGSSE